MNTKHTFAIALFMLISTFSRAQIKFADFESFLNTKDTFDNAKFSPNGYKIFVDTGFSFPCFYDVQNNYWSNGFAVSSMTDTITAGFSNLYSTMAGKGAENSKNYIVGQNGAYFLNTNANKSLTSFMICNTTYVYQSMKNGDRFAKKFNSRDRDSFIMKLKGFNKGLFVDSMIVYLANFTFADSAKAFIVKDWKEIYFPDKFIGADSFTISLISSDNGQFGMNTPGFVTMDVFGTGIKLIGNTPRIKQHLDFDVFPNPTNGIINIKTLIKDPMVTVFNSFGAVQLQTKETKIDMSSLAKGVYFIQLSALDGSLSAKQFLLD